MITKLRSDCVARKEQIQYVNGILYFSPSVGENTFIFLRNIETMYVMLCELHTSMPHI